MSAAPAVGASAATESDAHPLVQAARSMATDLLAPGAERVDAEGVRREDLRALGRAGLLGLRAPVDHGGSAAPPAVFRRIVEILAGADCSTWFVSAQHHSPVDTLARAPEALRERLLPALASGQMLSGVAFSHLRRWPDLPVRATRVDGGWRIDGTVPWYTGWGLSELMLLGAATESGEVIFAAVTAVPGPHLTASVPLRLAAMNATATVRLHLDALAVPDADVALVTDHATWARGDRRMTVNVNPAVLGLTETAVRALAERGRAGGGHAAVECAARLADRLAAARARSYALIEQCDPDEATAERLAARADAQHLMIEATSALVAAGGGGAMSLTAPAQRLAREAMFLLVQAQTADSRAATLERWAR